MTKTPVCVDHIRFRENAFEYFARSLAFSFESFVQETVDACPLITWNDSAAAWALLRTLAYVRGRII